MTDFRAVVCSGHCGSRWIATVVGAQPNTAGYHELRQHLFPGPWHEAVQHGPDADIHSSYFAHITRDLRKVNVLDSGSWAAHEIPTVHERQPIAEIIYLVRNPIQQMQSLWTGSAAWRTLPLAHFLFAEWLPRASAIDPWRATVTPLSERDRWGRVCELVRANVYGPEWLRDKGLRVNTIKLEQLVDPKKTVYLRALTGMGENQTRYWQQQDINRKVQGNRDPAHLWSQWSEEQRRVFTQIAAIAMDTYGYAWPETHEFA